VLAREATQLSDDIDIKLKYYKIRENINWPIYIYVITMDHRPGVTVVLFLLFFSRFLDGIFVIVSVTILLILKTTKFPHTWIIFPVANRVLFDAEPSAAKTLPKQTQLAASRSLHGNHSPKHPPLLIRNPLHLQNASSTFSSR
jgi:hypothetical protein